MAVGWEDSEFFPEGLILKLPLAGETFISFLLNRISTTTTESRFSMNPNFLEKICPDYKIQSVH